jgi:magnesium transporter
MTHHSARRWKHKKRSVRRPMTTAAPPGSISVDPAAPQPVMSVIAWGPNELVERAVARPSEIRSLLGQYPVTWVNVDGLGNADVIHELGQLFKLHPLALEDVVNTHQRAKTDDYGDVVFVVARMVQGLPLQTEQISIFVGKNFLLTFQEDIDGDCLDPVRERIRHARGRIRIGGPDYVLYELLDAIIDSYFPALEQLGEQLDLIDSPTSNTGLTEGISQLHRLRGELLYLRRIVWPHRDAVQSLLRGGHPSLSSETLLYLRDCYDHTAQLIDILEIYRESCNDVRDFYYSKLSNRTNEIMRTLTIIATIFMPMSFVAGVYGMNFDQMPELRWTWGYAWALGLMLSIAVSMLTMFLRRGWLKNLELDHLPPTGSTGDVFSESHGGATSSPERG